MNNVFCQTSFVERSVPVVVDSLNDMHLLSKVLRALRLGALQVVIEHPQDDICSMELFIDCLSLAMIAGDREYFYTNPSMGMVIVAGCEPCDDAHTFFPVEISLNTQSA